MRVLILGARGMLGQALVRAFGPDEVLAWDREEIDITDEEQVRERIVGAGADAIVNAAAYTNVDGAEEERAAALAVNEAGVRNVAVVAKDLDIPLVHYSTDYVFPGDRQEGYREDDAPGPAVNVYGESKLAGERALREVGADYYLLRTAWLYGPGGKNFVDTMLRLADEGSEVRVVNDQFGSPTFTDDVAKLTRELLAGEWQPGIYHAVNAGQTSWYEFAHKIFDETGRGHMSVLPVTSTEFVRPAARPAYSVLQNTQGPVMRDWKEALADYVSEVKSVK